MKFLIFLIIATCLSESLGLKTEFAQHLFNQFKKTHGK
jgi:hypothetical protein